MSRTTKILALSLLGVVVLLCIAPFVLEFVVFLTLGWIYYLVRTIPQMQVNWPDVGVGVAALAALAVGVHSIGRWLAAVRTQPATDDANAGQSANAHFWPARYSIMIVVLVVLMFVAGTAMIGMVHQMLWLATMDEPMLSGGSKEAASRNGSIHTTRQLALATTNCESAKGSFPQGCTTDGRGRLLHGWTTQLLPYIEEVDLYTKIDQNQSWDSQANEATFRKRVLSFLNPGQAGDLFDAREFAVAHYSANALALGGDRVRKLEDFSDGVSQTVLLGEAGGNFKAWGSPTNWRDPALGLGHSADGFGGPWKAGMTVVGFADVHVMTLSNDIDPQVFRALCTPAGGDPVDLDDL